MKAGNPKAFCRHVLMLMTKAFRRLQLRHHRLVQTNVMFLTDAYPCVVWSVCTSHVRLLDLLCDLPYVSVDTLYKVYLKYLHKLQAFIFVYTRTSTRGHVNMCPKVTGF
jgi:hypothetical protein